VSGRCFGDGDPLYEAYHDDEWGFPVTDERGLFERLCLEGFQSGLAWITILRKRPAFREAFAGFEPDAIARFDGADVERLMGDAGIVRNRAKIEATIANARATVDLRDSGSPLSELIWAHRPEPRPAPKSLADMPAQLPEAAALAKALKRAGFRFVGPTTVYAAMQACGLVNDHVKTCPVRPRAEAAQAAVSR
jgi:DNA-3-methyladenine glycosylase I